MVSSCSLGGNRDQLSRLICHDSRAVGVVIDSGSVKAVETAGKDFCGNDAGKKINGRASR